jgi:hypothetical protein
LFTLHSDGRVLDQESSESEHAFSGKVSGNTLKGKFYTTNPITEWEFEATMSAGG